MIDLVRDRPAMYMGDYSISKMDAYLHGYLKATDDSGVEVKSTGPPFGRFHDWVAARFDWHESTAGWCNIILKENDHNEKLALDNFFTLIEEFRESELVVVRHVKTEAHHRPTGAVRLSYSRGFEIELQAFGGGTVSDGEPRSLPPPLSIVKYFPASRNCYLRYNYVDNADERWKSSEEAARETALVEFGIQDHEWETPDRADQGSP